MKWTQMESNLWERNKNYAEIIWNVTHNEENFDFLLKFIIIPTNDSKIVTQYGAINDMIREDRWVQSGDKNSEKCTSDSINSWIKHGTQHTAYPFE